MYKKKKRRRRKEEEDEDEEEDEKEVENPKKKAKKKKKKEEEQKKKKRKGMRKKKNRRRGGGGRKGEGSRKFHSSKAVRLSLYSVAMNTISDTLLAPVTRQSWATWPFTTTRDCQHVAVLRKRYVFTLEEEDSTEDEEEDKV